MDIYKYIESCTKIDTDQRVEKVEWLAVPPSKNVNCSCNKKLPYHLKMAKNLYDPSSIENFKETEYQCNDSNADVRRFPFSEIRPSVREVGLGWNIFSVLEKRYRESQQKYAEEDLNESKSESEYSYTTATSVTDESYVTAIEDFDYPRRSSVDITSETSFDSSVDKSRYKKNALITKLLETAENDFSNSDQVFTDHSTDELNAHNLFNDISNKKEDKNKNNSKEELDDDMSEKKMLEDRVFRLFQSKEDEDVYVHPLREQIKEDPVWQQFHLSRKGIEVTETARHYYMNIPEEQFEIFEQVESKKKSKTKRKVKKYRRTFRM